MSVVAALAALTVGDTDGARAAAAAERSLLGAALAKYLSGERRDGVYDQPAAFEAFIRGGGNIELYRTVSATLSKVYTRCTPRSLLDIGCGDGMALVPALAGCAHRPEQLTVVEPAAALLAVAERELRGTLPAITLRTWQQDAASFVAENAETFDLAQATFALHAMPHERRSEVLAALRPQVDTIAIVEFDVPDAPHASTEYLQFLAESYEAGIAEYAADRDLVAQGFLMPVLTGQLAPEAPRATWEQPATTWRGQLAAAGYRDVSITPLCDYWSAPAFLLTARGSGRG